MPQAAAGGGGGLAEGGHVVADAAQEWAGAHKGGEVWAQARAGGGGAQRMVAGQGKIDTGR